MIACAHKAEPLHSRLAVVFATAIFSALILKAAPAATAFAISGMEPAIAGLFRDWGLLAITGVGGFCAFTPLFTVGVAYTSAAHAGEVMADLPLLTGLKGAVVERRVPSCFWFVGVAIAITGEIILVTFTKSRGEASLRGDLLSIAATFFAAIGYVSGSRLSAHIGTLPTTA